LCSVHVLMIVVYPQRLQIYNAPALEVATIGTFKLAGLFILSMACLVVAPNVYADEASPVWMAPAGNPFSRLLAMFSVNSLSPVIAASATVLPLFHVLTRPFVAQVFIDAPAQARRSKEALTSFARHLPQDTAMEIQTLGLLPWPRTKTLRVGQLRIRPEGWGRLANLEQVTAMDKTSSIPKWARWSLQRFYARPAESHWKKSRAPEIWPLVFQAITRNTVANMSSRKLSPAVSTVDSGRTPLPSVSTVRPTSSLPDVGQKKTSALVQKRVPTPKVAPPSRQNSRKKK